MRQPVDQFRRLRRLEVERAAELRPCDLGSITAEVLGGLNLERGSAITKLREDWPNAFPAYRDVAGPDSLSTRGTLIVKVCSSAHLHELSSWQKAAVTAWAKRIAPEVVRVRMKAG